MKKYLIDRGTSYKRKAAHNTNVTYINPPCGRYPKFVSQGLNEKYRPVWLQDAGYSTYYIGELFNAHTAKSYNSPHAARWNDSDFLLEPFTYVYLNLTYQRNQDEPVSYEGEHTVDILTGKVYGLLDEDVSSGQPFFLDVAPVAPHRNIDYLEPSGVNWIPTLPRQSQENLVDSIIAQLDEYGILDDTSLFTLQNMCITSSSIDYSRESLAGASQNLTTGAVTTHMDMTPTILSIAGVTSLGADFDGEVISLMRGHFNVEYWGLAAPEGRIYTGHERFFLNNAYKALRIVNDTWNLYQSVWCNGEHQMYDLQKYLYPPLARPLLAERVKNINHALSPRFDYFHKIGQKGVRFDRCEMGYIVDAGVYQFEKNWVIY
ncbi:arylsulfatase [Biscogniauxia marginata]|nr:arylsulfatase [Biscogniauxia marginata]